MTEPNKLTHHGVPDHQPAAGGIAARARAAATPQYLAGLNPEQREAVETLDGPVLVLAGAGTGKTRVLTSRIAHILSLGRARPGEILSVTFTNKAAREMKLRLGQMLGQAVEGMPWLGTFHSIGGRILRTHAELVQLKSNFTVLDVDDQIRLLKQLLQAENIDDKRWPARMLAGLIDGWKNRGLTPSQVPPGEAAVFGNGKGGKLYAAYQERLKILNAADFGDLLLENIRLFREHPDVLGNIRTASSSSWSTNIRTPTSRSISGCGCWRRRRPCLTPLAGSISAVGRRPKRTPWRCHGFARSASVRGSQPRVPGPRLPRRSPE